MYIRSFICGRKGALSQNYGPVENRRIKNPAKELNQFLTQYIKKQTKLIEEKKETIRHIVNNKNGEYEKRWEIKTKGDKVLMIDKKENKALRERYETKNVKKAVEKFIDSLPEEKKYIVAYARGSG